MQKYPLLLLFALFSIPLLSQPGTQEHPVNWAFTTEKVSESQYNLVFTAEIEDGWYVYSEFLPSDGGPIPTTINLSFVDGFEPLESPQESGEKHQGHDEMFDMEVTKFSKSFEIVQRVSVSSDRLKQISGTIRYMCCDNSKCLPPVEEAFTFELK